MPIVFASAVSNPGAAWMDRGLSMRWTGADGSVWDLADPLGAVPGMGRGVTGLHMPQMTLFESSSPLVPGVQLVDYAIQKRPVYWPLIFKGKSIPAWHAAYSAFFDSIHPVKPGTWTVGKGKSARTLELTGTFEADYAFDRDPFTTGLAIIGLELVASRPLWRGVPISQEFGTAEGVPFIDAMELAPTFNVSPAATFSKAEVSNPGNEPAYPMWTVMGPLDLVQIGIGDALIDVPFEVAAGSVLVIDTDPSGRFATLDGVDCTRELGFQMFAPVPLVGLHPWRWLRLVRGLSVWI
ncbi:hypothetical protein DC31_13940 [Microbacterium sp. CH12i]|uniref:hypothetical protein n=1 Tax=Microbacterium sp. CH12i TaxID=1479651 RepID=UPI00046113FE|nr:hypothetical protein [Microbacterium sp. CH12i]KDA05864.1 hypothetical protein DC31_13940 [Microbacterium sp. CH12i]